MIVGVNIFREVPEKRFDFSLFSRPFNQSTAFLIVKVIFIKMNFNDISFSSFIQNLRQRVHFCPKIDGSVVET